MSKDKGAVRLGGCTSLYSRTLTLQRRLNGMLVSLVKIHGTEYVTGLRFLFENGESASLGYIFPTEETYIDIPGSADANNPDLTGFRLAVCLRGITGIAGITSSGKESQWAGSYTCFPRMTLVARHGVRHLRGNFDVRITATSLFL